jgi:hypothetical protein
MKIRALLTSVLLASAAAYAQQGPTLQQDPSSGLYTITYTDEAGVRRSVRFFSTAQIAPEVSVAIAGQGPFQYVYTIKNGESAKVPLFAIDVPCEERSASSSRRPRLKVWSSVRARLPGPSVFYCGWTLGLRTEGDSGPPPGGQFRKALPLQSAWLPGIREAQGVGATGEIHFPGFRDEMDESIEQLFSPTQHPRLFPVVSPKYLPEVFSDPVRGTGALLDELTQACSIGWAAPDGICNSLRVKLEHAQTAASAGGRKATAQRLETYKSELRAQSGKHVAESFANAMIFDVEFMLAALR